MSGELLVAVLGLVSSFVMYRLGQKSEKKRQAQQIQHDLKLEERRREDDIVSKVANEYVGMSRRRYSEGPNALTRIGLERLPRDELIRDAIRQMAMLSGTDPWGGQESEVEGVDLVEFFKTVRERNLTLYTTQVTDLAREMKALGSMRGESKCLSMQVRKSGCWHSA